MTDALAAVLRMCQTSSVKRELGDQALAALAVLFLCMGGLCVFKDFK